MKREEAKQLAKAGQLVNPIRHETILVDPSLAASWLEKTSRNRKVSQRHVDRLVREILEGRWELTHQGVAFDQDGALIDGQQRLWAIVLSGRAVPVDVARNVRRTALSVIDTGRSRTLQDRLSVEGRWGGVSRSEASCLRRMLRGALSSLVPTATEEIEAWHRYAPSVRFALAAYPRRIRSLTTSTLSAVIARAWHSVAHEALLRFARDLCDSSAPLSNLKDRIRGLDEGARYYHLERALWRYLDLGPEPEATELFLLPGEVPLDMRPDSG